MELSTIYENKGYLSCYLPLFQTDAWCIDGPPNISNVHKGHSGGRKAGLTEAWFSVLHWWCCYGNRWEHPYGGHGVLKIVLSWTEPPRGTCLSVFDCGEQQKTHKCKCRVSRRKVRETHCGEAFGWLVCGRCLQCERNIFSISAWRFLNQCGCSSADGAFVSILHLRGCNWTTLSSSKHQLLLRILEGFREFSDEVALTWWNVGS